MLLGLLYEDMDCSCDWTMGERPSMSKRWAIFWCHDARIDRAPRAKSFAHVIPADHEIQNEESMSRLQCRSAVVVLDAFTNRIQSSPSKNGVRHQEVLTTMHQKPHAVYTDNSLALVRVCDEFCWTLEFVRDKSGIIERAVRIVARTVAPDLFIRVYSVTWPHG